MPSSTERRTAARPSAEEALLEKIEELSFLRALNDRLARVPDFASACRALVDLVWEDGRADAVAYVSVDPQRRLCRLEAIAPTSTGDDVSELAASIVDRHSSSAAEKRLIVTCHGACPSARADRRQLARVINNLVSNAIKYTPPSGRVDVTVASDEAGATLAVADTGYGLSGDDLPRLFTKYARFHQDKGIPGRGLGLYISKAIVEAHGGTIEVSSEPGRGSTFTVRLPHDTA